jgi:hypothetical protein
VFKLVGTGVAGTEGRRCFSPAEVSAASGGAGAAEDCGDGIAGEAVDGGAGRCWGDGELRRREVLAVAAANGGVAVLALVACAVSGRYEGGSAGSKRA